MNLKIMLIIITVLCIMPATYASNNICATYFTGIGCPHCAKTDPVVLDELPKEYPNLIIIEYEIYQQPENGNVLYDLLSTYDSGLGIPNILFNKTIQISGDISILQNIREIMDNVDTNPCPLKRPIRFGHVNTTNLPGKPKLWSRDRILIKNNNGNIPFELLTGNIISILSNTSYEQIDPQPVPLSGSKVQFENAIEINGWTFQWNGKPLPDKQNNDNQTSTTITTKNGGNRNYQENNTNSDISIYLLIILVIIILTLVFYIVRRRQ